MKKILALLLTLLMAASVTACGSSAKETETAEETMGMTETNTAIANPWGDYDTLEEAEAAAGFDLTFRDVIGCGAYYAQGFRAMDGMLEITYYPEGSTEPEDQVVIRQATKTDEDISGDYGTYSHDFTLDDCGIENIRLRGTKDSLAVCSFNYGDYSYVIYPGSMDYEETFIIIGELTGIDSTEYAPETNQDASYSIEDFVGDWDCEDSYLEDPDTYTGFYALYVKKNGEFSLYDAEAGNPGIAGTMTIDSDTELTVDCDEEDFDPPAFWLNMAQVQTLQYEFVGEEELHLIYAEDGETGTLVFHKE